VKLLLVPRQCRTYCWWALLLTDLVLADLLLADLLLATMLLRKLLLAKLLVATLLLAMMLAELLMMELLLVGLLLLLLLLGSSTHVVCQSLLNHQAGGEFTHSCISIAALGLISAALPARIRKVKVSLVVFQIMTTCPCPKCLIFVSIHVNTTKLL
jgi:hypothetical protein